MSVALIMLFLFTCCKLLLVFFVFFVDLHYVNKRPKGESHPFRSVWPLADKLWMHSTICRGNCATSYTPGFTNGNICSFLIASDATEMLSYFNLVSTPVLTYV